MALFNSIKKKSPHLTAVIVAAGNSSRMGSGKNKVLLPLGKRPVLWYTLRAFQNCPDVTDILVVTREEDMEEVATLAYDAAFTKVFRVAVGGATRGQSVKCALANLPKTAKYVAIHDGARPFVSPETVSACFKKAQKVGGAVVAVPCNDTLKRTENGIVVSTVDRRGVYQAQTPQIFDLKKLLCAISLSPTADYTDDSLYFENARFPVAVVEGSVENFKLTRESDMALANALVKEKKL